jgi:uncharacterized protein
MISLKLGQEVLVRQLWQGKLWAARPALVIKDTDEMIASWYPSGTRTKVPRSPAGERVRPGQWPSGGWVFREEVPENSFLRLSVPNQAYSVLIFLYDGQIRQWYVNLEQPLRRTALGFDEEDQVLDVILAADLKSWRWDDEDELQEAVDAGLISRELAAELYERGKGVVRALQSGTSVFNAWASWRPDPSWPIPHLPTNWAAIDEH